MSDRDSTPAPGPESAPAGDLWMEPLNMSFIGTDKNYKPGELLREKHIGERYTVPGGWIYFLGPQQTVGTFVPDPGPADDKWRDLRAMAELYCEAFLNGTNR